MKQYLLKVWMTAALSLLALGGAWGQTVTYSPLIGATDVSVSPVLSIEFDGEVTIGSGNIYVYSEDYNTFIEIPAQIKSPPPGPYSYSMNELLSVVGNTLFIDLTEGLLPNSTMLWVSIDASVISVDENEWDILDTWEPNFPEWSFTTVSAPTPLTATLSPADDATNVPVSTSTFEIMFSEDVKMADGVFFVSLFEKGVTPSKRNVELYSGLISNTIVSIDFDFQFLYGKEYEIVFPANAIKSVATGALFSGLSAGEWSFTTEVEPIPADPPYVVMDGYFPAPGDTEISRDTELRLTFNEAIKFGDSRALFLIHGDGSVRPLLPGSKEVFISGDELELIVDLSITPLTQYNTDYYVLIEPGFVKSKTTSAPFEGIALVDPGTISDQAWYFKTETAPPFWKEGYPLIDQQDSSKLNLNVLADQTGIVYAVITSNHVAPSAEQIALGQNAGGENALVSVNGNVESIIDSTVLTVNFGTSVPLGTVYYLHTVLKNNDDKYSDVESLAVDRIVPKINKDETYPEDGYSNMGVSEDIVIVFSEHVFGADGLELTSNSFSLNLVEGPSTSVPVDFSVSSTSERTTVTLTPGEDLAPITDYTITIQSVYDANGNASGKLTWSFQTDGEFTWTGAGNDNDWTNPENWGGTYVSGKSVVISGDDATVFPIVKEGDTVSVHNLTIEPRAVLTQTGGIINVSGEFHLLSSADRNASYLPQGGVLNVEGADVDKVFVHQVIPTPTSPEVFVFVMGSPTRQADALNTGSGFQMRWYDNTTDTWTNNDLNLMVPGVGYSVSANNDLVFRGEINRSSVQAQVTRTDGQGFGWNVLGNPFTAALDWSSIMNEAENEGITTLLENSFWVWDPSQSLYKAFNQETGVGIDMGGTIPSNHGFIVKVNIGEPGGEFDLKPSFLVNNKGNYLKSSSIVPDHVKISAGNERFKDKLAVVFIDEASDGVDKYDTEKRFGSGVNPFEIFTVSSSNKLTINSFPFENGKAVGLGYSASAAGEYTIEMSDYVTEGVEVLLIDNEYDLSTNLTEGDSYSFSIETKGVNTTRFSLIFSGALTTGVVSYPAEDLSYCKVYVDNGEVFVEVPNQWLGSRFKVTDISGRSVKEGEFATEGVNVVGAFGSGVHILSITSPSGEVRTQKIVVY